MDTGCCPSPSDLLAAVDVAATVPEMIRDDTEIGSYWLTCFQQEAGSFDEAWTRAVAESKDAINAVSHSVENGDPKQRYAEIADQLGLRKRERQGSGILTAVAGVALTWCDPRPEEALQIAVNAIGTDTDTIATMAGAILGATADAGPPGKVLDADLFRAEAARFIRDRLWQATQRPRLSGSIALVATKRPRLCVSPHGRWRIEGERTWTS